MALKTLLDSRDAVVVPNPFFETWVGLQHDWQKITSRLQQHQKRIINHYKATMSICWGAMQNMGIEISLRSLLKAPFQQLYSSKLFRTLSLVLFQTFKLNHVPGLRFERSSSGYSEQAWDQMVDYVVGKRVRVQIQNRQSASGLSPSLAAPCNDRQLTLAS